jgi:hypothetical protein
VHPSLALHPCVHQSADQWSDWRGPCRGSNVAGGVRVYTLARPSLAYTEEVIHRDVRRNLAWVMRRMNVAIPMRNERTGSATSALPAGFSTVVSIASYSGRIVHNIAADHDIMSRQVAHCPDILPTAAVQRHGLHIIAPAVTRHQLQRGGNMIEDRHHCPQFC